MQSTVRDCAGYDEQVACRGKDSRASNRGRRNECVLTPMTEEWETTKLVTEHDAGPNTEGGKVEGFEVRVGADLQAVRIKKGVRLYAGPRRGPSRGARRMQARRSSARMGARLGRNQDRRGASA